MKKNYSIVSLVQAFMIIVSVILFPVTAHSQDLTEAQKKERCQNNKNRIAELETQLRVINADLSQAMEPKKIADARTQMVFVRQLKNPDGWKDADETVKLLKLLDSLDRIKAQYNFDTDECERTLPGGPLSAPYQCLNELEKIIAKKINKAMSLNRPELLAKKNEIEKQLAFHTNNIIALGCNEVNANWNGTFVDANGSVTISSSGTSMSASFTSQGPQDNWKNVGQWTNCKVEGNTAKCDWSCSYSDNNKTGNRNGTLEVTLSGNTISGSSFEETPASAFNWKPGITDKYTKMGKGAVWPINMKRK